MHFTRGQGKKHIILSNGVYALLSVQIGVNTDCCCMDTSKMPFNSIQCTTPDAAAAARAACRIATHIPAAAAVQHAAAHITTAKVRRAAADVAAAAADFIQHSHRRGMVAVHIMSHISQNMRQLEMALPISIIVISCIRNLPYTLVHLSVLFNACMHCMLFLPQ
jgi:hypothetical protein